MYKLPEVDEVVAVSSELGINLGSDEATLYQKHLTEQISQVDSFVQLRLGKRPSLRWYRSIENQDTFS